MNCCSGQKVYRDEHASEAWPDGEEQVEMITDHPLIEKEGEGVANIMSEMEQPLDTVGEEEEVIIVNTPSEVGDII